MGKAYLLKVAMTPTAARAAEALIGVGAGGAAGGAAGWWTYKPKKSLYFLDRDGTLQEREKSPAERDELLTRMKRAALAGSALGAVGSPLASSMIRSGMDRSESEMLSSMLKLHKKPIEEILENEKIERARTAVSGSGNLLSTIRDAIHGSEVPRQHLERQKLIDVADKLLKDEADRIRSLHASASKSREASLYGGFVTHMRSPEGVEAFHGQNSLKGRVRAAFPSQEEADAFLGSYDVRSKHYNQLALKLRKQMNDEAP